jgi:hypothetical protein
MKQERTFVLTKDNKINYYKDQALYKGTIQLFGGTKVVKKGKDTFEIVNPTRIFSLSEAKSGVNTIDTWVNKIQECINNAKNQQ